MADPAAGAVRIDGLRDLTRELRRVDKALPAELRVQHREVAKVLVAAAKDKAQGMGGIWARASRSGVTAGGDTRHGGFIRLRPTKSAPFLFGAEFGAKHDLPRTVRTPGGRIATRMGWNHLPAWGGNQYGGGTSAGAGYFVYPTIREKGEEIVDMYGQLIDALLERAFPHDR